MPLKSAVCLKHGVLLASDCDLANSRQGLRVYTFDSVGGNIL